MTGRRIINILRKEWAAMFSELNSALIVTLLPLLIVAQGIAYIWIIDHFAGEAIIGSPIFKTAVEKLGRALPAVLGLPAAEQLRVFLLSQFNLFLLLIPTMIAMNSAAFSIVEEKLSRSLEPLLATPVRTWELLLGKALSGAVPALLMTWVCAGDWILVHQSFCIDAYGGCAELLARSYWLLSS
jgi:ABC-2 type transport system permease protein